MTVPQPHVVIVEDDASIGESINASLEAHGYRADWHRTGQAALDAIDAEVPDLILLDVGLPDLDGLTVCRWLRDRHRDLPIVLVTARDSEIDVVVGLDAGATDYVTKPYSLIVLLARIRAHLRDTDIADPDAPISIGSLTIDPAAYVATIDAVPIDLRRREFELLLYLARHVGRVITRERLLSDVWDLHWESSTKTVDMHVVALRRKLGDAVEISTTRGVGYRLVAP